MEAVKTLPPFKTGLKYLVIASPPPTQQPQTLRYSMSVCKYFILKSLFWTVTPLVAIMLEKEMAKSRLLPNIYH